jgi:hypothetical protein
MVRGRVLCVTRTAATDGDETAPRPTVRERHGFSKERDKAARGIQGTEHASRWEVKKETKTLRNRARSLSSRARDHVRMRQPFSGWQSHVESQHQHLHSTRPPPQSWFDVCRSASGLGDTPLPQRNATSAFVGTGERWGASNAEGAPTRVCGWASALAGCRRSMRERMFDSKTC